ncbi:uncharacterized protein B0I36DRAFT_163123 [Microdochium trichocladiopsis]|uniref:Uncharacterized protein n=1 Tax=Microdochium trichocladiopsis TaxID=1682393 RepID=A0A9P8Y0J6_9PEZI|nr:uncharacterized protein B0I36DRAFT_163123 [Microdochium trichocladiopsis]KAH7024607.1 hypothetical protein B0I36DRAFT_163123 [Microdochium trichocladiopsis]
MILVCAAHHTLLTLFPLFRVALFFIYFIVGTPSFLIGNVAVPHLRRRAHLAGPSRHHLIRKTRYIFIRSLYTTSTMNRRQLSFAVASVLSFCFLLLSIHTWSALGGGFVDLRKNTPAQQLYPSQCALFLSLFPQ